MKSTQTTVRPITIKRACTGRDVVTQPTKMIMLFSAELHMRDNPKIGSWCVPDLIAINFHPCTKWSLVKFASVTEHVTTHYAPLPVFTTVISCHIHTYQNYQHCQMYWYQFYSFTLHVQCHKIIKLIQQKYEKTHFNIKYTYSYSRIQEANKITQLLKLSTNTEVTKSQNTLTRRIFTNHFSGLSKAIGLVCAQCMDNNFWTKRLLT